MALESAAASALRAACLVGHHRPTMRGRIYGEVKRRPMYFVAQRLGFPTAGSLDG